MTPKSKTDPKKFAREKKIETRFMPPPQSSDVAVQAEMDRLREENKRLRYKPDLPFLYGWKWYKWAREFYESKNPVNLLCAANQISKSSTQIRKCVNWATNQDLWPNLWDHKPVQFWYLYPSKDVVNAEFETKWKQFLPTGEMKDDPYYGWRVEKDGRNVVAIHFNSGVHVYFKTYMQNPQNLQTGTCDAIFCDEELPVELYDELKFRLSAASGYFHMVFTATLGQDFWRRAMDPTDDEEEVLPDALKLTISLYEAMEYEDGEPSHWTLEKIKRVEAGCSTHSEVLKRVHGKFIVIGGRKYESFDIKTHMKPKHPIPPGWLIYEGVDIGGGETEIDRGKVQSKHRAHKSAIVFIAVRPDFRAGRVFLGWRGDGEVTTAGDVFQKHQELVKQHNLNVTQKWYDWGNKDFGEIATRAGDPFEKAEKSHEKGTDVLNTLFKNNMLLIYEDEQLSKLGAELGSILNKTAKRAAYDDFADALRYGVTLIPWDWSALSGVPDPVDAPNPEAGLTPFQLEVRERRKRFETENQEEQNRIEQEFDDINDAYEGLD